MEKQELIWVSKELADEYNSVSDDDSKITVMQEIISQKKLSIERELEALNDDALKFKYIGISYRKELAEIFEQQRQEIENLFNNVVGESRPLFDALRKIQGEVSSIKNEIAATNKALNALSDLTQNVNTCQVGTVIQMVDSIRRLDIDSIKAAIPVIEKLIK